MTNLLSRDCWVDVFKNLDGLSARNVMLTCQFFRSLTETALIWSQLVQSYKSQITPELIKYLPEKQSRKQIMYALNLSDPVEKLKAKYRLWATSLFVLPNHIEDTNVGHPTHSKIKQKRVFTEISEAIECASPGDFIYISEGFHDCNLYLSKSLNFVGRIEGNNVSVKISGKLSLDKNIQINFSGFSILFNEIDIGESSRLNLNYCYWGEDDSPTININPNSYFSLTRSTLVNSASGGMRIEWNDQSTIHIKNSTFPFFPVATFRAMANKIKQLNQKKEKSPEDLKLLQSLITSYWCLRKDKSNSCEYQEDSNILDILIERFKNFTNKVEADGYFDVLDQILAIKENHDHIVQYFRECEWKDFFKQLLLLGSDDEIFSKTYGLISIFVKDPNTRTDFKDIFDIAFNKINSFQKFSNRVKVIRMMMDTIVYSTNNASLRDQFKEIGKSFLQVFQSRDNEQAVEMWLPWVKMVVNEIPYSPTGKIYLVPEKSFLVDIAPNGLLCKSHLSGFASGVFNVCLKTGKWYFEVKLITSKLFQIGYVTDKFTPDPKNGSGVGDDEESWGVDLFRNVFWHKELWETRRPYAVGTKWKDYSILQCYINLDDLKMSYGYNGIFLGDAWEDFSIGSGFYPAFSAEHAQECEFNFGDKPFAFPIPLPGFLPLNKINGY